MTSALFWNYGHNDKITMVAFTGSPVTHCDLQSLHRCDLVSLPPERPPGHHQSILCWYPMLLGQISTKCKSIPNIHTKQAISQMMESTIHTTANFVAHVDSMKWIQTWIWWTQSTTTQGMTMRRNRRRIRSQIRWSTSLQAPLARQTPSWHAMTQPSNPTTMALICCQCMWKIP